MLLYFRTYELPLCCNKTRSLTLQAVLKIKKNPEEDKNDKQEVAASLAKVTSMDTSIRAASIRVG